jgi:hypothetical protein
MSETDLHRTDLSKGIELVLHVPNHVNNMLTYTMNMN